MEVQVELFCFTGNQWGHLSIGKAGEFLFALTSEQATAFVCTDSTSLDTSYNKFKSNLSPGFLY